MIEDSYANYSTEEDGPDAIYFKLISKVDLIKIMRGLLAQKVMEEYKISFKEEDYRTGYVCQGWRVEVKGTDYRFCPIADIVLMIKEMGRALGHNIRFISYNKLINLK